MRFLLPLFLLCFSISNAQNRTLSGTIQTPIGNCNSQLKLFKVVQLKGDTRTVVLTKQDTNCIFSFPIAVESGNYTLEVSYIDQFKAAIPFSVSDSINAEINLGNIVMESTETKIDEVTITGVPKKFIVIDAEKTTITVENNPILEVSTIYDAILKIPGIIPYPGGGFAMGGQLASIYFEGIPSSLSTTDLDNLLKSLPATSVQKIELISNPGASYDATTSGAIIDIISQGRVTKWISGTITLNAGFNQNQKYSPSFLVNGKGKKYTWQLQTGYSNYERNTTLTTSRNYRYFDTLTELNSKRKDTTYDQYAYFKPSMNYRITKNSYLQLNIGASVFKNNQMGNGISESNDTITPNLITRFTRKGKGYSLDGGVRYRVFLDTLKRKLELSVNYNHNDYVSDRLTEQQTNFTTYSLIQNATTTDKLLARLDLEIPLPNWKSQLNVGSKFTQFSALSKGNYRYNDTTKLTLESDNFQASLPFDYSESNLAGYAEWKLRLGKKVSVTAGVRAEDFTLSGSVQGTEIIQRHYFNLFPSVHTLYRISSDINFMASYSRKINIPNYSQFDPNVTGYFDNYTTNTGNSSLAPNFSHHTNTKLTIFDYCQISFDYSVSNTINLSEIEADSNSFSISQTFRTYKNVQSRSFFFALPVPFGIFSKGLDFFQQAIDVDAISFMYLYANNNKTVIPSYNYVNGNKSWWTFGLYSQFILPWKIRMNVEYTFTARGVFQLSETTKPIHELEVVFSKEFFDDKWRVSLSMQDVLNTNNTNYRTSYSPLTVNSYSKQDTQSVWIKVAYSFGRYEKPSSTESAIPDRTTPATGN